ncbi:hypothetical protein ANME2D_02644 [Candidatus Methanoperedens nitroreducens]|uniref:CopG family transcriptional regulator n=1 Tax=Candidatus Methanoperedens nitratireducens TaxID=1392998 RepID=A0A062V1W4_9EURY|nr:hypothetical protein [Candidatus Methanoperedens nitroreducens]KCZ70623.1 hypothetical protein ANME2D_02644 [Candidatus Methanoperedens nitroreducens]MDJ1420479.1 hypothetical protein [Candidatus Methanoperedens sp.]
MSKEFGEIKIPKEIIRKIEERIDETEFKSADEYIIFVLEEVLKEEDGEEPEEVLSEEDEQKVKERLRALGYLD